MTGATHALTLPQGTLLSTSGDNALVSNASGLHLISLTQGTDRLVETRITNGLSALALRGGSFFISSGRLGYLTR